MTRVKADGIAVGVEIGAKIALSWRGEVAGEPVGRDTVSYGASLTKQFIGFLLAGAVEAGLISVDDGALAARAAGVDAAGSRAASPSHRTAVSGFGLELAALLAAHDRSGRG